jgi:hypothetical protein
MSRHPVGSTNEKEDPPLHSTENITLYRNAELVENIKVEPHGQRHIPLGSYSGDYPLRGFSIELEPIPTPVGSVTTEVTSRGTSGRYQLTLHITNHGTKAVKAAVWRL